MAEYNRFNVFFFHDILPFPTQRDLKDYRFRDPSIPTEVLQASLISKVNIMNITLLFHSHTYICEYIFSTRMLIDCNPAETILQKTAVTFLFRQICRMLLIFETNGYF